MTVIDNVRQNPAASTPDGGFPESPERPSFLERNRLRFGGAVLAVAAVVAGTNVIGGGADDSPIQTADTITDTEVSDPFASIYLAGFEDSHSIDARLIDADFIKGLSDADLHALLEIVDSVPIGPNETQRVEAAIAAEKLIKDELENREAGLSSPIEASPDIDDLDDNDLLETMKSTYVPYEDLLERNKKQFPGDPEKAAITSSMQQVAALVAARLEGYHDTNERYAQDLDATPADFTDMYVDFGQSRNLSAADILDLIYGEDSAVHQVGELSFLVVSRGSNDELQSTLLGYHGGAGGSRDPQQGPDLKSNAAFFFSFGSRAGFAKGVDLYDPSIPDIILKIRDEAATN